MSEQTTEPMVEIRVHIDRLEYTREGLKTRAGGIQLEVGKHNRVVLVRPKRQRPSPPGNRGFPHDSSLPLVGTLRVFWDRANERTALVHEAGGRPTSETGVYQVFAHTSPSGDESYNKLLSDRRAEVGRSILSGDPAPMIAVATAEGWGMPQGQSLLRCLGCDPGPLDALPGKLTTAATATFAKRYNSGFFRSATGGAPTAVLPEDGEWSEEVRDALIEALVAVHGFPAGQARLHPSHPAHGCSEFNAPPSAVDDDARRLSLVHHPSLPDYPDAAPCQTGDDSACAVVDGNPQRCMFYREHVAEPAVSRVGVFDPRWLWIDEDRYVLSVLTDAADGEEVVFDVVEDGRPTGDPLERITVNAAMGAAAVVWRSSLPWQQDGRPDIQGHPSFIATHTNSSQSVRAPYPRRGVFRILLGDADDSRRSTSKEHFRVLATDGSYDETLSVAQDAVRLSPRKLMLEFEDVPLDVLSSVFYGFGPQPELEWMHGVLLGEATASRHGAESIDTPFEDPPAPEDWADWEHADRVGRLLAKYENREPLQDV